ncbi:hypothetical protein [Photobacterium profundum]|uniref:Uncharacterized protein n=1 Tax=Photobacterium profundum 3TCK TaxID=314280 RepID=Q1Z0U1_9GAMM|nr:hypothetical protein [Photobacterium profundum]EAS42178.1 hypothetical protein P3TCK_17104 [Photobacterium profundum 3TCK]
MLTFNKNYIFTQHLDTADSIPAPDLSNDIQSESDIQRLALLKKAQTKGGIQLQE